MYSENVLLPLLLVLDSSLTIDNGRLRPAVVWLLFGITFTVSACLLAFVYPFDLFNDADDNNEEYGDLYSLTYGLVKFLLVKYDTVDAILLSAADESLLLFSSENKVLLFLIAETYGLIGSIPSATLLALFSLFKRDDEEDEDIPLLLESNESRTPAAGKATDNPEL